MLFRMTGRPLNFGAFDRTGCEQLSQKGIQCSSFILFIFSYRIPFESLDKKIFLYSRCFDENISRTQYVSFHCFIRPYRSDSYQQRPILLQDGVASSVCFLFGQTTPNIAPSRWVIWTPSNTWFLGLI